MTCVWWDVKPYATSTLTSTSTMLNFVITVWICRLKLRAHKTQTQSHTLNDAKSWIFRTTPEVLYDASFTFKLFVTENTAKLFIV